MSDGSVTTQKVHDSME